MSIFKVILNIISVIFTKECIEAYKEHNIFIVSVKNLYPQSIIESFTDWIGVYSTKDYNNFTSTIDEAIQFATMLYNKLDEPHNYDVSIVHEYYDSIGRLSYKTIWLNNKILYNYTARHNVPI